MTDYTKKRNTRDSLERIERGRRRKAQIRKRRIRKRNRMLAVVGILLLLIAVLAIMKSCTHKEPEIKRHVESTNVPKTKEQKDRTEQETKKIGYKVRKPKKRQKEEVYAILKEYSKSDTKMKELYDKRKSFATGDLNKVINNPEMIDFVLGLKNNSQFEVKNELIQSELEKDDPLFIQWDKRWAYVEYGDSNIGMAGCGPTCIAMAIFALTKNTEATPVNIANYSDQNGYYVEDVGTSWELLTAAATNYNVTVKTIAIIEEEMKRELDRGHKLICSVSEGDFTTGGHFIEIYGYTQKGFKVNDPYCIARSKKKWSYEKLSAQIRSIWCYGID